MQNENRQSYGIVYKSLIFFLILYLPVLYVHELGHSLICVFEGGQVETLYVSWIGEGHSSCSHEPNNQFLYHISGGAFASALSAILLIVWRTIPNYVKIVSITFAISQGINALVEALAHVNYINDDSTRYLVFNAITFALFTGLMILYIRQPNIQNNSGFSSHSGTNS